MPIFSDRSMTAGNLLAFGRHVALAAVEKMIKAAVRQNIRY
jgi:hypothetical protein